MFALREGLMLVCSEFDLAQRGRKFPPYVVGSTGRPTPFTAGPTFTGGPTSLVSLRPMGVQHVAWVHL
jgi:hypothetical protein